MKHYGDITKINGYEVPIVDVITGGSPCQDLSVAGKRAGLAGQRSGLFMEQMRIVKEMRERDVRDGRTAWAVRPRYMVWENVPGAFSSGSPKGADFAAVIEEIIKVAEPGAAVSVCIPNGGWTKSGCYYAEDGSWSIAWRVHDAQFWGVPQRRKRIALVADFGGLSAPEILFERKGLSGDSEQSGEAGEGASSTVEGSADGAEYFGLDQQGGKGGANYTIGVAPTLAGDSHGTPHGVAYGISSYDSNAMKSPNPHSGIYEADTAGCNGKGWREDQCYTLNTIDRPAVMAFAQNQVGEVRVSPMSETLNTNSNATGRNSPLVYDARGNGDGEIAPTMTRDHQNRVTDYTALCVGNGQANQNVSDKAGALNTMHDQQAVMVLPFDTTQITSPQNWNNPHYGDPCHPLAAGAHAPSVAMVTAVDCRNGTENPDTNGTLQAKSNGGISYNLQNVCRTGQIVRRLTPLECERLQGYPDGWTNIGEWTDSKGKKHGEADSPRYKALGNSIALPFWQYLARRICAQYERNITMASLFDGIGGFPLVFERCGAKAVWASEIEEFPIAVTKRHFSEDEP